MMCETSQKFRVRFRFLFRSTAVRAETKHRHLLILAQAHLLRIWHRTCASCLARERGPRGGTAACGVPRCWKTMPGRRRCWASSCASSGPTPWRETVSAETPSTEIAHRTSSWRMCCIYWLQQSNLTRCLQVSKSPTGLDGGLHFGFDNAT